MKGWTNSKVFLVGQFGQLVSIHQTLKRRQQTAFKYFSRRRASITRNL